MREETKRNRPGTNKCAGTIVERLENGKKIINGCWVWGRALNELGYGKLQIKGVRENRVHRLSYEHYVETIQNRKTIDHLCRNRACFNPAHLEMVSQKENVLRGEGPTAINKRKTHCKNGHRLSGHNLIIKNGTYGPTRNCRTCRDSYAKTYREGKRK